jgi:PAS domain S-box-containing protein
MDTATQSEYEKLELIVGAINAGIWDWTMDDDLEWWSPRLYELLGYADGEIPSTHHMFIEGLLHPEDRPRLEQALDQHFYQGRIFRIDIRLRHKSGEYRWYESVGKAAFDAAGKPRRMSGSIIDITERKYLNLELEKRELLLQEMGIMTQTGVWEIDLRTKQIRCSRELYDIFQVAPDFTPDLETLMDFYAPEAEPVMRQRVKEALVAGQSWDEELKFITAGKQEIWVRSLGQPLMDATGAVIGLRGVLKNINDRKLAEQRLKASEEKFRKMFELSPVGMTLTNLETGAFVEYNQAFLDSVGYSAEELKSITFPKLIPQEFIPAISLQIEVLRRRGVYGPFEVEHIARDGHRVPVLLNGMLMQDKQGQHLVWSFLQDISQIKRREQEIADLNEELKALNVQKDQLFSVISHDLRGTIGTTGAILDFLSDLMGPEPGEIHEIILKARQSTAMAKALVEDLLLWARNQMDKVPFEPIRLPMLALVEEVFQAVQAQADLKHLELLNDVPANLAIKADAEMMKVCLRNLVSNAIKYSYPEGKIILSAGKEAGQITIAVRDEGVGIKPEHLPKLFNKKTHFTTLGTQGEKGSGLGLILCQEFIQKHGGRIWVTSQPNQGSTFSFSLPDPE